METNNIKTCSFCGRELIGRADKKYCDDNCRNNHHYKNKKDDDSTQTTEQVEAVSEEKAGEEKADEQPTEKDIDDTSDDK